MTTVTLIDASAPTVIRTRLGLDPLTLFAAVIPASIGLVFTRDLVVPLVFLGIGLALALIVSRVSARVLALLVLALPVAIVALALLFALWVDPATVADTRVAVGIAGRDLTVGALTVGAATALRLAAITALLFAAGSAADGPDLVRALVQHLRVPYRVGYAALAALRFVPRFARELDVIRRAHRVRDAAAPGPFAALARGFGYAVPLLAGAIRHAERVALAMDARAFGAHATRTEPRVARWHRLDTAVVAGGWVLTVAVFVVVAAS
ncbi:MULTISPECIES: energy-coupling factor transporter transmembrane component T family protein [Microbacterium]|uniref:energy-coupling factor transporter transmembrane component T family protein n=1 Tax=Microbacterium TaxID=33882 RepID=UPI0010F92CE5|nr:energy-coupling factor transporter transmembrane component T [Microbacterium sp. 4NA327F11]MCK9916764.1 energy-coupling factor transporter transmembrane protein EcfT [Microbacteriaceae bacterium K1510]